jgi:mono/diheme cytochrome c family protein
MKLGILVAWLALIAVPAAANETGRILFEENCSGCHQVGGIGSPGLAPPLIEDALWAALGEDASPYLAGVLIGGLSGTIISGGETYVGLAMPAQQWMSDTDLTAVADYVLNDLNGLGVQPAPELFAQTRLSPPSHADLRQLRKDAAE